MSKAKAAVLGAAFLVFVSGCGKPKPTILPAEGVVRINGQPLRKAVVQFVSKNEDYGLDWVSSGMTDDQGHYTLNCNGQPGAMAGPNLVLVRESPPPSLPMDQNGHPQTGAYYSSLGGRPVPQQYANVTTSPLTAEVKAGQTEYDFDLTR
jgi:hypothetical protein